MRTDQISPTSIHVASVQKRVELARRLRDAKYGQMPVPFPCIVFIGSLSFYTAALKCIQVWVVHCLFVFLIKKDTREKSMHASAAC
jgi:hypothetical protein